MSRDTESKGPMQEPELAHAKIDPAYISTVLRGLIATGDYELLATGAEGLAHRMDEIAEARVQATERQSVAPVAGGVLAWLDRMAAAERQEAEDRTASRQSDMAFGRMRAFEDAAEHIRWLEIDTEHQSVCEHPSVTTERATGIDRCDACGEVLSHGYEEGEAAALECKSAPPDAPIVSMLRDALKVAEACPDGWVRGFLAMETPGGNFGTVTREEWGLDGAIDAALLAMGAEPLDEPADTECRSVSREIERYIDTLIQEGAEYSDPDIEALNLCREHFANMDCGSVTDGGEG